MELVSLGAQIFTWMLITPQVFVRLPVMDRVINHEIDSDEPVRRAEFGFMHAFELEAM